LISAALRDDSPLRKALQRVLERDTLIQSLNTFETLERVLYKKKFEKYLSPQRRKDFLGLVTEKSEFVNVKMVITACCDPKDNKFLELAVTAHAAAIISGDQDLLILHPFENIPILTSQDFLAEDAA